MQTLHAQQRGASPPFDIDRRIGVGVKHDAAMLAGKDRLAFAASAVYGSALGACLRGVGSVDERQPAAALGKLVVKHRREDRPALREDRSVEACLLLNVAPRRGRRAARRRGHVGDAQLLQRDRAKALGDAGGCLMQPVSPNAAGPSVKFGDASTLTGIALRPALASGKDTLRLAAATLNHIEGGRRYDHLARGKGKRVGDASVDANRGTVIRGLLMLDLAGEGDMPAVRSGSHGRIEELAAPGSRVAEAHPSDLRQAYSGPSGIEAARFDLAAGEAEGVVQPFATWRREACSACEEVGESLVQVAQRLLLAGHVDGANPIELGAQAREVGRLHPVSDPVATAPGRALFEGEVVDEAANASELLEKVFLLYGRVKFVTEAADDHADNTIRSPLSAQVFLTIGGGE